MNWNEYRSGDVEGSLTNLRYINWSDHTGFVCSTSYDLSNLCHKRPRKYLHNPRGFANTTFWKMPGDKFPLFCLTEPHGKSLLSSDEPSTFLDDIQLPGEHIQSGLNLKYKLFNPSEKSLWRPNFTYMIFWWCPEYFDFEVYEKLLMSHVCASVFEKKCEIKINETTNM